LKGEVVNIKNPAFEETTLAIKRASEKKIREDSLALKVAAKRKLESTEALVLVSAGNYAKAAEAYALAIEAYEKIVEEQRPKPRRTQ
jgi:hypothetical protein